MGRVLLGVCLSEPAFGERSGTNEFKEWSQEMLGELWVSDAGSSRYRGKISSIYSVSDL